MGISKDELIAKFDEDVNFVTKMELFQKLKEVIAIGPDKKPVPMTEEEKEEKILPIILWWRDTFVAESIEEMFDAYNRVMVLVLIDGGVIPDPDKQ